MFKEIVSQDFNLNNIEIGYRYRRWKKALYQKSGKYYDFLKMVLNDVQTKKKVKVQRGSIYQSCANFIVKYGIHSYKYTKSQLIEYTCCHSYPKICGGKCCVHLRQYDDEGYRICATDFIPKRCKRYGNCYDDCCSLYKIKSYKYFILKW